jgi:outer membrane protein OmpA-like peptidoglycan-associated protein
VVAWPAQAQTAASTVSQGAAVDTFRGAAPGSDWFSTDSLDFRGTVRPAARVLVNWGHALLVVRNADGSVRSTPVENQLWFNVGAGVTLFDRVRVFANVPVAAAQSGALSEFGGQPLAVGGAGVGDLGFGADVRLVGTYGSPFTLAVGATMTAPTGAAAQMLGDGVASVQPRVMAAGQVGLFAWAAQAGFNVRGASIGSINFGNEVRFAASAGVRLFDQRLLVGPEFFAVAPVTSSGTSRSFAMEGDLGAHFALTPQWRLGAGVGTGLVNGAGVPDVRVLASVDWVMAAPAVRAVDADGDGVPDADDACPRERGVASRGGCAAPADDDLDGVPNADDLCPAESSAGGADPKRPGCAFSPDSDGDGVPDAQDQCSALAPAGLMDPKRPGCPDRDGDRDGVTDSRDACPAQASGAQADPARPGCPVPDADGDTVPDAVDRCPNEKGVPAMEGEKNGCPGLVRLEEDRLLTTSPVYFAPGTATLLPRSFPVLESVKSALQAMPAAKVVVEGHTDGQGKVAANQALSQKRAEAVRKWLIDHGVDEGRLEARGYGMSRLLVLDEKTAADRQANRRVEFHLEQR